MLKAGDAFAGYTVVTLLGAGGMGEVYVATHPRLPRTDALKVLTTDLSGDQEFRRRFNREADLVAGLSHPNIVTIHDRGEYAGRLWLTMELIDGHDVQQRLRDSPRGLPIGEVSAIVSAVADALNYAGSFSLLHRDVKPANILVSRHGQVVLTDFGIARLTTDTAGLTGTGMTVGTLSYSSPEQLLGSRMDGRTDQYSLAATAFALLTGHPPFRSGNPADVISAHLSAPVPSVRFDRPELSAVVDHVLARGMAKNPADRFADSGELASALTAALHGPARSTPTLDAIAADRGLTQMDRNSGPTQQVSRPSVTPTRSRAAFKVLAVVAVAALALLAGGGLWLWKGRVGDSPGGANPTSADGGGLPRVPATPLLASLENKPTGPRWTLDPQIWGSGSGAPTVKVVGGDAGNVVFLAEDWRSGRVQLLLVNAATGAPLWPAPVEVPADSYTKCAVTESVSAVACATDVTDNRRLLILNGSSGALISDVPFGEDSPTLSVSGESIAVTTFRTTDFEITVYRPDGGTVWSRTNRELIKAYPEQGIVTVTGNSGPGSVRVLRLDTGEELFSSTDEGTTSVNVFAAGFAVSAPRGDAAAVDFFNLDGAKTASGVGWSAFSSTAGDTPASLPVLKRSDQHASDNPMFGVVNPISGRGLWEVQEFNGEKMVPVGTHLVVGQRTLVIHDIYTGESTGDPLTVENGIDNVLGTDDSNIAFSEDAATVGGYTLAVYDITTGAARWRLDVDEKPVAFGDGIYTGTSRIV